METLIKLIAEKADITEDKAKIATEVAIEFIKERVAHTIDNKVSEAVKNMAWVIKAEVHEAVTGEPTKTWGEKVGNIADKASDKIEDFTEDAGKKLGEWASSAKNFFGFGKKEEEKKDEKEDEKGKIEEKSK
jgi:hypothetical protein